MLLPGQALGQSDVIGQIVIDGRSLTISQMGANVKLPGVTDTSWWYGCSPTSAGMMMGYYDRNGYGSDPLHNKYPNLVPGGVAETTTYGNPGALVNAATASAGHIADFYAGGYNASGDDKPTPYHSFNCLADFMGTSQDAVANSNGSTTFYYYTDGSPLYVSDDYAYGISANDGTFGIYEYINYAGYGSGNPANDTNLFCQLIYGVNGNTLGFTWQQYMAEINAGRPMLIQVEGHTMLGYGYDNTAGAQTIILHDTWSEGEHTMTWGGSYSGLAQWGVVGVHLTNGVPEPATLSLLAIGVLALIRRRRA
jgi:hypothetical protein